MKCASIFLCTLGSGLKVKSLPLGSGPKVKSQATVLWRQTRGLRVIRGIRARHKKRSRSDSRFTSSFKIEDLRPLDLLRAVCYTARSIRELLRGFPKPAR
jgi:hypothetical protein